MIWSVRMPLCCVGFSLLTLAGARADGPGFAELLARAHAEAAAGHQWEPAGDNVTETFMQMMNLLPQATPEQLAEFQNMLQAQQQALVKDAKSLPNGSGPPVPASNVNGAPAASPEPAAPPSAANQAAAHDGASSKKPAEAADTKQAESEPATPPAGANESARSQTLVTAPAPTSAQSTAEGNGTPAGTTGAGPVRAYAEREMPPAAERGSVIPPLDGGKSGSAGTAPLISPAPPALNPVSPKPDTAASSADSVPATQPKPKAHGAPQGTAAAPVRPPHPGVQHAVSPEFPSALVADMFARGEAAEKRGDISGARRYYQSAADQGLAKAARALARLYDPAYLRQGAIGGIAGDPALAELWKERAAMLEHRPSNTHPQALSAR